MGTTLWLFRTPYRRDGARRHAWGIKKKSKQKREIILGRSLGDEVSEVATRSVKVVLVATYELGRQPWGLASASAWLRARGADVV